MECYNRLILSVRIWLISQISIVDCYLLRYDEVKTQTTAKIKSKPEAIERKLKNTMKKEHNKEGFRCGKPSFFYCIMRQNLILFT